MSTALQLQEMIVLYQGKKRPFSPLLKIGCKLSVHLPVPHDDDDDDVYHDDDGVDNNNHLPGAHVFTSFLECVTSSSLQLNHLLI